MKNKRPKIEMPLNKVAYLLEFAALIVLLANIVYLFLQYNQLPNSIPIHFNIDGKPDAFGNKNSIVIPCIISVAIYALLSIVGCYPHTHNYMVTITEENAAYHYRNSQLLLRIIKVVAMIVFLYITYSTVQIAMQNQGKISGLVFIALIAIIFAVTIFFIYKTFRTKNSA